MKQKFLLASVTVLLLSLTTKAQIGKGSVWLGGNIGYSSVKTKIDAQDPTTQWNLTINPAIGKAISENTIAGIDLLFSDSQQKNTTSAIKYDTKRYGAGLFMRWYVPVINRLYIFGQGRVGFDYLKEDDTATPPYGGKKGTTKGWDAGLYFYPGVSFAVNKKFQLEAGFNNLFGAQYTYSKSSSETTTIKTDNFTAGINLDNKSTFTLGFRLLINNKG